MLLIPAIDLKGGKCVRLRQGRMEEDTVFSNNPIAMALHWVELGATRLHLIDLDGAFAGKPVNADIIYDITQALPGIDIQVGGGIRDGDTIQTYLDAGVRYVIIGTKAINAPHFVSDACLEFPGHIILGLDAKDGRIAIDGWSKLSRHSVIDIAQHFEKDGVEAIIYTDIQRDGMMNGVNAEATSKLAEKISIPVIASGGVSSLEDINELHQYEEKGISGAIIGRALYEGKINLTQALSLVQSK
ncbi:1-(5-phosphoribosyl)-5-[(5-phosphoribosylamino)methylideneamino]imidazole-4-carboxamide isomerase [Candidatus Nitrosacidococcus tergens]|uniref:1-(5-phosphoribosyl)-5-[(5-phosphoribosylamino)methylideneamino] imidazole-4-carboxamide isomerase n=1 Tax=Candidatus Nitrosacidococcus tergens TaxID=553981 RepID=A0A7G1QBP3_9GAMM|nr:1-(5-phosphoribosyl)-5-[(5-phosphoribosylamino)methylideneamino]imidazole-4-carboxamide isomerase [Candidatus Nitrosacidococcus tergens]CAB1277558.1 Phosphoribosylformimino-5-aminoimidazole carboxamide ribotide isomerase [Candidatus Nitrosacidococcus tergens]